MSTFLGSSPLYILNLPNLSNFTAEFQYRYYTQDEALDDQNQNPTKTEDFKNRYGDPRSVVLSFDAAETLSADDKIGEVYGDESVLAEILNADNINKITSELMMQSSGYTKHTSEIVEMQQYVTNMGTGQPVSNIDALFKGASSSNNAELYSQILNNVQTSQEIYLNSSTGRPLIRGANTLSDAASKSFIATSYVHDIVEASANNPFSIHGEKLSNNINSLKAAQVRQRKIISPLVVNLDEYNILVETIQVADDPLQALGTGGDQITGIGVLGYVIFKTEIDGNTEIPKPAIAITNRTQTSFTDVNVKYGAKYKYDIHPLFLIRYKEADERNLILLVGTDAKTIQIETVENVPPPPIEAIRFEWNGSNVVMHWSMPMGQINDLLGPIGDIKGYQIFCRNTVNEPFALKQMLAFYDGYTPFKSKENMGLLIKNYENPPVKYDLYIEPDRYYIVAMCVIDAHGNSSNLSPQYSIKLDSNRNVLDVDFISYKGAPKQYPNFFMSDKIFLDCIKVSNTNKVTVFYNPDYRDVRDSTGGLIDVINPAPIVDGEVQHPSYRIQMININTQSDEILDIFLPNSE